MRSRALLAGLRIALGAILLAVVSFSSPSTAAPEGRTEIISGEVYRFNQALHVLEERHAPSTEAPKYTHQDYVAAKTRLAQFNGCQPGFCPGNIAGGSGGIPSFVPFALCNGTAGCPDIYVNYKTDQAWIKPSTITTAAAVTTVSRSSPATQVDSAGAWSQCSSSVLCRSDLGATIWEARTNAIRNNTMAGAVVMADGVQLLNNPTFAAQGNWTVGTSGGGSVVFGANQVQIAGDGATDGNYVSQQLTGLTIGRNYVVVVVAANGTPRIGVGTTQGAPNTFAFTNAAPNGLNSASNDRISFTATQTSHWISFSRFTASAITITSVAVYDGERVQNGTFSANPINAAQNTVQNGWQWSIAGGTSTVTYTGGNSITLTCDGAGNEARADSSYPTVAGFTYTVSVDVTGGSGNLAVRIGTSQGGLTLLNALAAQGTGQKFQFTATGSTTWIRLAKATASASIVFTNISVQSAGAIPTNWQQGTATGGLYRYVTGVGTDSGINTVDMRVAGTTTDGAGWAMRFDTATAISALYGQTWTGSFFASIVGGSTSGITTIISSVIQRNSGGSSLGQTTTSNLIGTLTSSLQRVALNFTLNNSATAFVQNDVTFGINSGATVDVTIRLGWPQLENNSGINSTVVSAVKAADGTGGVNGSAVYSVGGGTCPVPPTLNVTWAAGAMTVNSVANSGSCTVFPPSPATLSYSSGTATGWTGATVTLTPTDKSALAAASPPILTSAGSASRNAESDSLVLTGVPAFGSAYTVYVGATMRMPGVAATGSTIATPSDGTANNRLIMSKDTAARAATSNVSAGVSTSIPVTGSNWAQNSSGKLAATTTAGDQAVVFNGGTPATAAANFPVGTSSIVLGASVLGGANMNGDLTEVAVWATQRVPNTQMQGMTQ